MYMTELQMGTTRGVISDKWSMRVLWLTAIGSAVGMMLMLLQLPFYPSPP